METQRQEITEKERGGFFIRKATMIQKNTANIKDVYKIDGRKTLGEGASVSSGNVSIELLVSLGPSK